jgi:hypothetical protein
MTERSDIKTTDMPSLEVTMGKFKNFCQKILEFNAVGTSTNPVITRMTKFFKVYDIMEEEEKKELIFNCFYVPHKKELLQKGDDYSWLEAKSVKLEIGGKNNSDRSMMCSTVFKKAVKIKKDAEKSLEGLPENAAEEMEELNFVDIYLLYFFRLLRIVVTDETENKTITEKLKNIESDLGMENRDPTINKTGNNNGNPLGNLGGMIGDLGKNLGQMFQSNNANSNNPMAGLNLNGIMKTVQNLVGDNNPSLSKQIGETFGDLGEAKSPQDLLNKAVGKLGDKNLQDMIKNGVSQFTNSMNVENPMNNISTSSSLPPISDAEISQLQITGSNSNASQQD